MDFTTRQAEMLRDLTQDSIDSMESVLMLDNISRRTLLPAGLREQGEQDLLELKDAHAKLKEMADA